LEAINGIGHAAVMTNPEFRAALAEHGYRLDPETGEITQLAPYSGTFSARSRQIETNVDRYEAQWRRDHPGEEPGPAVRRAWDRRAWADARPDKVVPVSGSDLRNLWIEELIDLGFRVPTHRAKPSRTTIGSLDRDALAKRAVDRLGARRSAWNAADIRGEVEKIIASCGVVARGTVRRELAEDLTARAIEACVPLVNREDVPEHIRALSSPDVLAVEYDLVAQIINGARREMITVVEGAAGAGKTRRLAATREQVEARGGRMIMVTPTRKAPKSRPTKSAPKRGPSPSCSTSTASAGTTRVTGTAPHRTVARRLPHSKTAPCSSSTRPACSTRTAPAPSCPLPTRAAPTWRSSATGTNFLPSAAAARSTSRRATPPTGVSSWAPSTASTTRRTPNSRSRCGPGPGPAKSSASCCAKATS
jgi:hypothetical protein